MLLLTPYQPTLTLLFGTRARCLPSASSVASPHRPSSMFSRLWDSEGLIADTTVYYPLFTSSSSATLKSHVSLPGQAYCFPVHIAATDKRPDIVIGTGHQYMLVELTVPFKENFADAECRKRDFYTYLLWLCTCNRYKAHLIMIQVGSRGVLDLPSLSSRCASPQWKFGIHSLCPGKVSYLRVFCNLVQLEHQISTVHYTNLCCDSV